MTNKGGPRHTRTALTATSQKGEPLMATKQDTQITTLEKARMRIDPVADRIAANVNQPVPSEDVAAATLLLASLWDTTRLHDLDPADFDLFVDLPEGCYLMVRRDARKRGEHR